LHALPKTALHARMKRDRRMIEDRVSSRDGTRPNFRTVLPSRVLLRGFQKTLTSIYDSTMFYERAWRSLEAWQARNCQRPAQQPGLGDIIKNVLRSIWHQGISSSYRRSYWKYFFRVATRCPTNPAKLWMGFIILISGHHFIPYAQELEQRVEREILEIDNQVAERVADEISRVEKLGTARSSDVHVA
jgi:hypothetical protein